MDKDEAKEDRHHRINRANGKRHCRSYPVKVDEKKHKAFHALFGHKDTYQIADELNAIWIDPRFYLVVEKREQPGKMSMEEIINEVHERR